MKEDKLAPARGMVYGLIVGFVLWAIIILGILFL